MALNKVSNRSLSTVENTEWPFRIHMLYKKKTRHKQFNNGLKKLYRTNYITWRYKLPKIIRENQKNFNSNLV